MAYLRATSILAERELTADDYNELYDSLSVVWRNQTSVKDWELEHNVELSGFYIWGDVSDTLGFSPPDEDCIWLSSTDAHKIYANQNWDSLPGYTQATELQKSNVREAIVNWLIDYEVIPASD